jgi:AraC-like DNA-binding protein
MPFSPAPSQAHAGHTASSGKAAQHWSALLASEIMPGQVSLDHSAADADQAGSLQVRRLANGGKLANVHAVPQEICHTATDVGALQQDALLLTVTHTGSGRIDQGGHSFDFGPGDLIFRRARVPSRIVIREPVHQSFLWIPAAELASYMPLTGGFDAAHFPADASAADALCQTSLHACSALHTLGAPSSAALERALVQLALSAYLDTAATRQRVSPRELLWRRCMQFIDAQLCDPELDAQRCADALRVSPRYFYALLAEHGVRFRAYLLEQRLLRVQQALASPSTGEVNISALAFRHGFSDAAHFSQAFRKRFEVSPSEWRQRALRSAG